MELGNEKDNISLFKFSLMLNLKILINGLFLKRISKLISIHFLLYN